MHKFLIIVTYDEPDKSHTISTELNVKLECSDRGLSAVRLKRSEADNEELNTCMCLHLS